MPKFFNVSYLNPFHPSTLTNFMTAAKGMPIDKQE